MVSPNKENHFIINYKSLTLEEIGEGGDNEKTFFQINHKIFLQISRCDLQHKKNNTSKV